MLCEVAADFKERSFALAAQVDYLQFLGASLQRAGEEARGALGRDDVSVLAARSAARDMAGAAMDAGLQLEPVAEAELSLVVKEEDVLAAVAKAGVVVGKVGERRGDGRDGDGGRMRERDDSP